MRTARGFTLIELMITVAIIAVLAGVAYPGYQEQMAKAKRADAASALFTGAQALERHYTANGRYLTATNAIAAVFPTRAPENGTVYYNITATVATANAFTLRATRAGAMTGDPCGDLELTSTGIRSLNGHDASRSVADCWRR